MASASKFPPEFRREAVDLVRGGTSQADVCRLLGVSDSTISKWVRLDRERSDPSLVVDSEPAEVELRRLRKKVREQQVDIGILKKSLEFFVRETNR